MKLKKIFMVLGVFSMVSFFSFSVYGAPETGEQMAMLEDGEYEPSVFTWSGGTGRVQITCPRVEIREGQAYATVVFDSDAYGYVKLDGEKYLPDHSGGGSAFEIPVTLEEPLSILGMTTKMSSAHEIQYELYISLSQGEGEGLSGNGKLDEEPPAIPGYSFLEEEAFSEGDGGKLFCYDKGLSLLELPLSDEETIDQDSLYDRPVLKYLLVPQGTALPPGLEKEAAVIETPVEAVFAAHPDTAAFLEEQQLSDVISSVGFSSEECQEGQIRSSIEEGDILVAGTWEEPEYKTILKGSCRLALLPPQMASGENREQFLDICQHFSLLGIPVLVDLSQDPSQDQEAWRLLYERIL